VIFGFNPLGSAPIGAYVPHGMVPVTVSIRYAVGPHGWACGNRGPIEAGTVIDWMDPRWWEFVNVAAPQDAIPLNQYTYDWMTSNYYRVGLGYFYTTVAEVPGVVGLGPPWPGWENIR
jgi:hypothetical protein